MYLTGFTDEADPDIYQQIRATKELGWSCIECRHVRVDGCDTANLIDIPDAAFERVVEALDGSGVGINCFSSAIANWAKQIDADEDSSFAEAKRAIPRMQRLGSRMLRIMSYAVRGDYGPNEQMFDERVRRLNKLVPMFLDAGIQPVHENCMNYGGMGYAYTLRLLEAVPGLKLVFDTGNPVFTDDRCRPQPYAKQSAWEFYAKVKQHVAYVHIKDGLWRYDCDQVQYTFPGEGEGDVRAIVKDLLDSGYDGGFSMEPHMAIVHHEQDAGLSEQELRYKTYIEYGRRFERLLADIGYPYQDPGLDAQSVVSSVQGSV